MREREGEARAVVDKLIALVVRKPTLTSSNFLGYWRTRHGPLVATTPDYGRFRTRYIQNHFDRPALIGGNNPFEGMASVWLPDAPPADFAQTAGYRDRIRPDEAAFLDLDCSLGLAVNESIVIAGGGPAKAIMVVARDQVLERRAFHEALRGINSEAVCASVEGAERIRGLTINSVRGAAHMSGRKPDGATRIDCILEFWFDNYQDLRQTLEIIDNPICSLGTIFPA